MTGTSSQVLLLDTAVKLKSNYLPQFIHTFVLFLDYKSNDKSSDYFEWSMFHETFLVLLLFAAWYSWPQM